jgi:carboxymethylenebutenolidase
MRIVVFGAAGRVGSRVVTEAISRGHEVTAVVRDPVQLASIPAGVDRRVGDATRADQVAVLSAGQDLVVGATRPIMGKEEELVAAAEALLGGVTRSGVRLLLVGGAGSLNVPETGCLVVDEPRYVSAAVRDIALACCRQFEACRADVDADWTYISPPARLLPGERTGRYRVGRDELLFAPDGSSTISIEDFAVALLDEAESPKHRRSRFTIVADARPVSESDVTVRTADGLADGYFVHPATGTHPGVLLWPDVLGLRPAFRTIGRRLAAAGHSVLIMNPHYRKTSAPLDVDMDGFQEPAGRERVFRLSSSLTSEMTMTDAVAFTDYLDHQACVDLTRKMGTLGYCAGGAMAIRTAASVAERVGAVASFHGAALVTKEATSPHLLVPKTRARALIAIAQSDDEKDPTVKAVLRRAYDEANLPAEIEVYSRTRHGWCSIDAKVYDPVQAGLAWSRLLGLFGEALA